MSGRRYHGDGRCRVARVGNGELPGPCVAKSHVESQLHRTYRDATVDIANRPPVVLPPKPEPKSGPKRAKSKREKKPLDPETEMQRRVADAALLAAQALADAWPGIVYADLRAVVVHALFVEMARAGGMRVQDVDALVAHGTNGNGARFFEALRALPLGELTAEHFGAAHEQLSSFKLEAGKIVSSSERRGGGVHFTPRSLTEPIVLRTLEPILAAMGVLEPGKRLRHTRIEHLYPDPNGPEDAAAALLEGVVRMPKADEVLALRICDPAVGAGAFLLAIIRILGALVDASWKVHGGAPITTDALSVAKQLVALHCCYGVDKSPPAVASTKLALTLECRADAMPLGWLDGNIKCGDALVGLDDAQIARFHWSGADKKGSAHPEVPELRKLVDEAMRVGAEARRMELDALSALARGAR